MNKDQGLGLTPGGKGEVAVNDGAEAFVEMLNANGVDYIFLNPGTDTFPVQEALSKFQSLGRRGPQIVLSLHESVAMAAAHGHFMVSGRPQLVFVHVDMGTQNVGGALHSAQRGRIGVVLCAGRAPLTSEGEMKGGRSNWIHWVQEQTDQAGIVRGYVKWEYEIRRNENIHQVMQRAFQVASSEPCGPVYLTVPRELLMERMDHMPVPGADRHGAVAGPGADPEAVARAAEMLVGAQSPLILVGDSGRHPQSVAPLVDLAESLGAPVVSSNFRMNFPTVHPLYAGILPASYVGEADVILIIDQDIPYLPARTKPRPDARIIHMDIDPLKASIPLWLFPTDLVIHANSATAIPALGEAVRGALTPQRRTYFQSRTKEVGGRLGDQRARWDRSARDKAGLSPISPEWLCHCLGLFVEEDDIVLEEVVTNAPILDRFLLRGKPGTMFRSGGSSLGWGLGAAMGVKLAAPDKMVITLVGDGNFVFCNPTAALWAADIHHTPYLCVIFNNRLYRAPKRALSEAYGGESASEKTGVWLGVDIAPPPDYAMLARASRAYGETVTDPGELVAALGRARKEVLGGRAAVVDVWISEE